MLTFSYLTKDVINSLNLIEKENDNLLLGSFCGAVIELLGRILIRRGNSKRSFNAFIEQILKNRNSLYSTYKNLLWDDLRGGGVHSILPKGGVVLTGDKSLEERHLKIGRDPQTQRIYLVIFTPQFLADLRDSILEFASMARKDESLADSYKDTILGIVRYGKQSILLKVTREKLAIDFEGRLDGDIKL